MAMAHSVRCEQRSGRAERQAEDRSAATVCGGEEEMDMEEEPGHRSKKARKAGRQRRSQD